MAASGRAVAARTSAIRGAHVADGAAHSGGRACAVRSPGGWAEERLGGARGAVARLSSPLATRTMPVLPPPTSSLPPPPPHPPPTHTHPRPPALSDRTRRSPAFPPRRAQKNTGQRARAWRAARTTAGRWCRRGARADFSGPAEPASPVSRTGACFGSMACRAPPPLLLLLLHQPTNGCPSTSP